MTALSSPQEKLEQGMLNKKMLDLTFRIDAKWTNIEIGTYLTNQTQKNICIELDTFQTKIYLLDD